MSTRSGNPYDVHAGKRADTEEPIPETLRSSTSFVTVETLSDIHGGLAQSGIFFFIALGVWAIWLRIRARPLDSSWYGAAVIGELLIAANFLLGWVLYGQGLSANLSRGFVHILYATVAVITLPAAYLYLSRLRDENVKTVLFAIVCFFLMEVIIRARVVVLA